MTSWSPPIWRTVPGARRYAVSDRGQVRNSGGLLVPQPNDEHYPKIKLIFDDGRRREVFVHRLVAFAFLPPPMPGQRYVLHGNRCRTDCSVTNLRWGDHAANHEDRVRHGSRLTAPRKLLPRHVATIRRCRSAKRAALTYGISLSHARDIRSHRRWA